ncbi:unnamed protein product [Lathyrus oleraceus]
MGESAPQRYAVVTGSNKGIGFEIVKQLASSGIKVVLTARDEQRGLQALETLKASGLSHSVVFHQLDVADAASVAALADFLKSQFGKLDILVNNAGIGGVEIKDRDLFTSTIIPNGKALSDDELRRTMTQSYQSAKECLEINYLGAKKTFECLLPLLQLSISYGLIQPSLNIFKLFRNSFSKQNMQVLKYIEINIHKDKNLKHIVRVKKDFKRKNENVKYSNLSILEPISTMKDLLNHVQIKLSKFKILQKKNTILLEKEIALNK